jgi:hypothetical protein
LMRSERRRKGPAYVRRADLLGPPNLQVRRTYAAFDFESRVVRRDLYRPAAFR